MVMFLLASTVQTEKDNNRYYWQSLEVKEDPGKSLDGHLRLAMVVSLMIMRCTFKALKGNIDAVSELIGTMEDQRQFK